MIMTANSVTVESPYRPCRRVMRRERWSIWEPFKSIAPAIRVGYMVLPEALLERYRQKCACFSCTVSRVDQAVLEQFLDSGAFERHLNRMRKSYSRKHEALLDGLKPLFGAI